MKTRQDSSPGAECIKSARASSSAELGQVSRVALCPVSSSTHNLEVESDLVAFHPDPSAGVYSNLPHGLQAHRSARSLAFPPAPIFSTTRSSPRLLPIMAGSALRES